MERDIRPGDIVRHFKREYINDNSGKYLYQILNIAHHSEDDTQLVVYQALYEPYIICARPLQMFLSEVDHIKYPDIKQKYRFELIQRGPEYIDWQEAKKVLVRSFPIRNSMAQKHKIVFTGSSLMENFPVEQWCNQDSSMPVVYNRGVGGYKTTDLIKILQEAVFDLEPSQVFINIGTNDLADPAITPEQVCADYKSILQAIKQKLPECRIVMLAYYHGNFNAAEPEIKEVLKVRTNSRINEANALNKNLAASMGIEYYDLNFLLDDNEGNLKPEYSLEGLHVNEAGYRAIYPKVMELVKAGSCGCTPMQSC